MSKIQAWKCDVCQTVFKSDDVMSARYNNNSEVTISFDVVNQYIPEYKKKVEVCLDCRTRLLNIIEKFFDEY